MGVIDLIAKTKSAMLRGQGKLVQSRTDYIQKVNLAEAELTRQRQELREVQQIQADLRADQTQKIKGVAPSKLQALGKGMAKHLNKNKAQPKVSAPQSRQVQGPAQGSIFGGQRNIEVGGGSPFGQTKNLDVGGTGGSPFNIGGRREMPKPQKK